MWLHCALRECGVCGYTVHCESVGVCGYTVHCESVGFVVTLCTVRVWGFVVTLCTARVWVLWLHCALRDCGVSESKCTEVE